MSYKPLRFHLVDLLRGTAVAMMMFFHFCFLLNEFNLAFTDFLYNLWWLNFRTVIVSTFLLIVGISLQIAHHNASANQIFYRRQAQLLLYASIITITTYLYAPERVVIFGILQFILVASWLARWFINLRWLNVLLGSACIFAGLLISNDWFNQPMFSWIGLASEKPITYDYVPLLPWFGVVLIGAAVGQLICQHSAFNRFRQFEPKHWLSRLLILMGRHSLNLYMVHMPIFYGFIAIFLL